MIHLKIFVLKNCSLIALKSWRVPLAALFFVFGLTACDSKLQPVEYFQAFQNMRWLAGSWEGAYQGKPFYETWRFANDTLLENINYTLENGDTVVGGRAVICVLSGQVYYASVGSGKEPSFQWKLRDINDSRVRFENPKAPYSQTIIFEHRPDDRWQAVLVTRGDTLVHLLSRRPADKSAGE